MRWKRASGPGSVVRVTMKAESDGVEIVVADSGVGIARERLPTLFTFGLTTKGAEGNGLGLWTARHIVTRHGGDIGVESEVGQGTRFTLWWPRKYSPTMPTVHAPAVPIAAVAAEAASEVFHR